MNLIDKQNSLIIDVTYKCNAKCKYCQWGNPNTPNRIHQSDDVLFISNSILKKLDTQRIVFSGGEPLLRTDLEEIISYYNERKIQSIITITNGMLLSESRLRSLILSGLTGITFSIDSFIYEIIEETRFYSKKQYDIILSNFNRTCELKDDLNIEIGINTVLSSKNINNDHIENLIEKVNALPIDWLKFQPIFDDGYVGINAPHLLLLPNDAEKIRMIGKKIKDKIRIETNSSNFWESVANILEGRKLDGSSCGLDKRQAIAQNGMIKICSWINYPSYDFSNKSTIETQIEFSKTKANCNTGMFCFCLQNLSHEWRVI